MKGAAVVKALEGICNEKLPDPKPGNPLLGEDGNPLGPYVLEDGALRLRMGE